MTQQHPSQGFTPGTVLWVLFLLPTHDDQPPDKTLDSDIVATHGFGGIHQYLHPSHSHIRPCSLYPDESSGAV